SPDLGVEERGIMAVRPLERPAVDRDQVGQRARVRCSAPRMGDAVIEAEEVLAGQRLVLDDDRDVVEQLRDVLWKGVEGVDHPRLETFASGGHISQGRGVEGASAFSTSSVRPRTPVTRT